MGEPQNGFRTFALEVHGADGVSDAAVLLQDQCAVDVDVLLFAAFVGAVNGQSLGGTDLEEVVGRVGAWQKEVIGPLRAIRRRLKSGPLPAPSEASDVLRDGIKRLELDAEMIEIDELAAITSPAGPPAAGNAIERATAAILTVVRSAATREPTVEERDAIATIAAAAGRLAGRHG